MTETAKDLARQEGKTAGSVISELARRGLYAEAAAVPGARSEQLTVV